MIVRVLQEISDKPAQQASIAGNLRCPAGQRAVLIAGAFLRHQRDQIDRLGQIRMRPGLQPAHEQDFVDQRIQLGNVVLQHRPSGRIAPFFNISTPNRMRESGVRNSCEALASNRR